MSVRNCFPFGSRWPNFGPLVAKKLIKLGENSCFWPPVLLSTRPNWFLVCIIMWWVFRNYSIFLPHRPKLVLLVALDILPFSLIKRQVVTCILWCLVRICSNQLHIQGRQFCSKWFQYNHLSCPSVIDFAWMVQMAAGIAQFWSGFVKCLVDIYLAIWKREETQFDLLGRFHGVRLDWNQCHGWVLVWTHPWHWFRSNLRLVWFRVL